MNREKWLSDDRDKILSRCVPQGGCLVFTGGTAKEYGRVYFAGRLYQAHRVIYEYNTNQRLPRYTFVDHKCFNHACCDIAHLREVTPKENQENRRQLSPANGSSGVRGVSHHKASGKWQVSVRHNWVINYGGLFLTKEEAEHAAVQLRKQLFTHNNKDREGL